MLWRDLALIWDLTSGILKSNSDGDSGGVEGTVREPEVAIAAGVPVPVENRSQGEERRLRREMWQRREEAWRDMQRRKAADRAKLALKNEPPGGDDTGGRGPPL